MFHVKRRLMTGLRGVNNNGLTGRGAGDRPGRSGAARRMTVQRLPDNAEASFKCARCGHMFGTEGRETAACPRCGHVCTIDRCAVLGASNEDY